MKKKAFIKSSIAVASLVFASMFGFSTAFGYGGGSGSTFTNHCSSVSYGEWGPSVNGFQYRNVTDQAPSGCYLSTSQQIARSRAYVAEQVLGEKKYAEGTLLKGSSHKIYVVIGDAIRHISNPKELANYHGPILKVSDEVISSLPKTLVLGAKKFSNGTLVKAKGDIKIYVIKDGKKVHIKSLAELKNYKGKTLTVEASELNNY